MKSDNIVCYSDLHRYGRQHIDWWKTIWYQQWTVCGRYLLHEYHPLEVHIYKHIYSHTHMHASANIAGTIA